MEWAILYGALCTVTDCAWQKIDKRLLGAGMAAGAAAAVWRVQTGREGIGSLFAAALPAVILYLFGQLTEGKIGRADSGMVLTLGLLLGGRLCTTIVCIACLLVSLFAGAGLAFGRLTKTSRIPFAPFLLSGMFLIWLAVLQTG